MQTILGYEEKQEKIKDKIENELSLLPEIFKKYIYDLRDSGKAETTVYSYLNTLTSCIRGIIQDYYITDETFYANLDEAIIMAYFDSKYELGVQALQRHWSVLNSFFSFLVKNNYIVFNPMQSISRPTGTTTIRKLNYLNYKEVERLIATIKHNPTKFTAFRDEVIIKLALTTGIDLADIVNLDYEHIDFSNNTIHVFSKKGERTILISPSMAELLKKWIQFRNEYFRGSDTSALFVSTLKNRISVHTIGQIIEKHCEEANVPIITFKDLKSTMVYLLARENVSMEAIMELLGISDYMVIVQAYDAAIKEKNANIINVIDGLFEKPFLNVNNILGKSDVKRSISIELKNPEYSTYVGGGQGFTIFANIRNLNETPLKIKLKSCAIFMGGMLRISDYAYSGYQFDEETILPNTTKTFGKIWITDKLSVTKIRTGDYLILSLMEVDSKIIYQIKYTYNENHLGGFWSEDNWYEMV